MRNRLSKRQHFWQQLLPRIRDLLAAPRIRHINLFFAITFCLAFAIAITIAAAWLLAPFLNVGTQETPPADLTKIALTIAAGVGGVVALVVAYRRQRGLEQGSFLEGFGAAAKQLGDTDVAVRLAGVYAMAGVADQSSKSKRQQCIDVLCGYLRLPYSPELGNNHQSGRILKKPVQRKGGSEEEIRFQYRQNDKEVRKTIVRVIVAHLQKKAPRSWSSNDFDFTGSHIEEPHFFGATFRGRKTSFADVTLSGEATVFSGTTFSGEYTSFRGTTFGSEKTWFLGATFSGRSISFEKATFGGEAWFDRATFSGEETSFSAATFSGKETSFSDVIFGGNDTSFTGTTFGGMKTSFMGTTFGGMNTSFFEATFSGEKTFFVGASFTGGGASFECVDFGVGRVDFSYPRVWNPTSVFDWNREIGPTIAEPANVEPQDWPPG